MRSDRTNSKFCIIALFFLSLSAFVFLNTRHDHVCSFSKERHHNTIEHVIHRVREFVKTLHVEADSHENIVNDKPDTNITEPLL